MELAQIRELLDELDVLLGLRGNFRPVEASAKGAGALEDPDQIKNLLRELLVDVLGLEVQGL